MIQGTLHDPWNWKMSMLINRSFSGVLWKDFVEELMYGPRRRQAKQVKQVRGGVQMRHRCLAGVSALAVVSLAPMLVAGQAPPAAAQSEFVRQIWSESTIAETLPYFDVQSIINRVMWEGA
jgi:hypothetical protein